MSGLLKKQIKADLYTFNINFRFSLVMIPLIYLFFFFTGNYIASDGRGYSIFIIIVLVPFSLMSYFTSYFQIYANTFLSMGGTRKHIFKSQMVLIIPMSIGCGSLPLFVSGLAALLLKTGQGMEILRTVFDPAIWLLTICGSIFGLGIGSLLSILVNRFGRKIYMIAFVLVFMLLMGGVAAITATSVHESKFLVHDDILVGIQIVELMMGILFYGLSRKYMMKMEVR